MTALAWYRLFWLCPVAAIGLVGCERQQPVGIQFALVAEAQIPQCNIGVSAKWYGYDFELQTAAGDWVSLPTTTPVHLVELGCGSTTAVDSLSAIPTGKGPFSGLRFTIGVPPHLNHQNPAAASAPLNRSDMFWVWQQGYKFLSVEAADGSVLHLGSTGCLGPAPVRPPTSDCGQANRLTVTIDEFDPRQHTVGLDLTGIMQRLGGERCTGNYAANSRCRESVNLLGLDHDSGACGVDCGHDVFVRASQ